jgi:hypothetical protein
MAAGARPDRIARVEMIGGFPSGDQGIFFDSLPVEGEWAEFEGPVAADLSPARRAVIEAEVVPVPATFRLLDQRHFEVPVTVRCSEFSAAQSRAWVDGAGSPSSPTSAASLTSNGTAATGPCSASPPCWLNCWVASRIVDLGADQPQTKRSYTVCRPEPSTRDAFADLVRRNH